ncbi:MAG: lamin tail domain-containing protein [Anaerolineae bacterium]
MMTLRGWKLGRRRLAVAFCALSVIIGAAVWFISGRHTAAQEPAHYLVYFPLYHTALPTPTPTPTFTPTPTPRPTATPTPQPRAVLRISALRFTGQDEYIEIRNDGSLAQDMTGWRVFSEVGAQMYHFPQGFRLSAGDYVRVHSGPAAFSLPPHHLFWTQAYIWNNEGDVTILLDAQGREVDRWAY